MRRIDRDLHAMQLIEVGRRAPDQQIAVRANSDRGIGVDDDAIAPAFQYLGKLFDMQLALVGRQSPPCGIKLVEAPLRVMTRCAIWVAASLAGFFFSLTRKLCRNRHM